MSNLKKLFDEHKSTYEESKDLDSHVLIIDGLNTFIRVFSAVPALNDDGQHVGGIIGFLRSIGSNIRQFQCTRCVVIFDGVGGSLRRKKLYGDYKAGRRNKSKLNRLLGFENIVDEQRSMKEQFARLAEYLDILPITLVCIDNIEADDSIAYIVKQYYEKANNRITIVSTDQDFLQLVTDKVNVYNPIKKILFAPDKISEKYFGIIPENFLLYRIIGGDSSDNITGINGIGLKTLVKRFPEVCETPVSIERLYEICRKQIDSNSKTKIYTDILANKAIVDRNSVLMQLDTVDISGTAKLNIINKMNAVIEPLNTYNFKQLYIQDKLYSAIKDVDLWLRNTFNRLNVYADRKIH